MSSLLNERGRQLRLTEQIHRRHADDTREIKEKNLLVTSRWKCVKHGLPRSMRVKEGVLQLENDVNKQFGEKASLPWGLDHTMKRPSLLFLSKRLSLSLPVSSNTGCRRCTSSSILPNDSFSLPLLALFLGEVLFLLQCLALFLILLRTRSNPIISFGLFPIQRKRMIREFHRRRDETIDQSFKLKLAWHANEPFSGEVFYLWTSLAIHNGVVHSFDFLELTSGEVYGIHRWWFFLSDVER